MSSLLVRAITAIIFVVSLIFLYMGTGVPGLVGAGLLIVFIAHREFARLAFHSIVPPALFRTWFSFICLSLFLVTVFGSRFLLASWGVGTSLFLASSLWLVRDRVENKDILSVLSVCSMGLIYIALFPALGIKILLSPNGQFWFVTMIAVVAFGDIFAYFGGRWFGKRKIMESISPKKTWAGSVVGAFGSIVAGLVFGHIFLSHIPPWFLVIVSIVTAFVAQTGDLFASLLKRVASVKDSGHILPGHGGILDRIDGMLFAAPVFYAAIAWSQTLW